MAHFVPTKKSFSADDTMTLLADQLNRYHGFLETVISGTDPRFQSEVWAQLCSRFNIQRAMPSPYHPQTDSQTESVNRTLEQMLRTYIQADKRDWEGLPPALELAYNSTHHSSTDISPLKVMIGENPVTAADLDIIRALPPTLTPPITKLFRQLCDRARSHILRAKWRQKYYADSKRRAMEYKVGNQVWLRSKHLPALNHCTMLEPRYRGPLTVAERVGKVAYPLALQPTCEGANVFHVSQLVSHYPREETQVPQEAQVGWPPVCKDAGNPTDQFIVDDIIGER
ncbi:hypothetical protein EMWEY_00053950 [Eimeria maxima]|uniref:Integrase catalytic domain-containing protein n=1 Tax=Eimeria maxima TaxID=5804 RepID=U6M8R5_EIMMA|nr:hypothetical protein EMWEY_00053950 [Eimeria maxima]CDJ58884.1 hypothetical protein EMWEY_00053950 [Eimeria maxima]